MCPPLLWHCWYGSRKGIWPIKISATYQRIGEAFTFYPLKFFSGKIKEEPHSAAMCSRAWRAQWPGFDSARPRQPTKELFLIIPMHVIADDGLFLLLIGLFQPVFWHVCVVCINVQQSSAVWSKKLGHLILLFITYICRHKTNSCCTICVVRVTPVKDGTWRVLRLLQYSMKVICEAVLTLDQFCPG